MKGEREPVYVAILKDSLFEFATKTNSVAVFTAEKNEFYNVYHYFIIDEQRNKHNSIISDNIQNQLKTASKQNIKTIIFDSNVFFNSSNIDVTWLKDNLIKHFKTNQTSPIKNILFFTSFNYAQVCQDFNANNESFKKILFSFFIKNNPVKKILEIFKETSSFISNISNYELYKLDIQNQ